MTLDVSPVSSFWPFFSLPLFLPPTRPYAGNFFLVFVLFHPCSSSLFLLSAYVVLPAAPLIFSPHILQNSCRLFLSFTFFGFLRYLRPHLRVVSSVQQLSVPLQHVCCSCSPSDLASHSSELPSAFFVFLVLIFLFFLV